MQAPKKSVGQGLSRKPTYRAICLKFNLLCDRSSTGSYKCIQAISVFYSYPTSPNGL